jgi:cytochrome c biogenesis protein CcmG/thiol:disulfide interchange protein DsbE
MKKKILISPIIIFFLILLVFFYLLIIDRNPSELPSVLINKKVPEFEAKSLLKNKTFISPGEFGNETTLVNFFATWCKPCRDEHPYLKKLSDKNGLKIIGINYKDDSKRVIKWLKKLGNPYSIILLDSNARLGIDWGVYGLPETFIINSNGVIKYRLVGPITKKNYDAFVLKVKEVEK